MPLNAFKHRVVRDLAWVIASPPLISGDYAASHKKNKPVHFLTHEECLQELSDCSMALQQLDHDPSPLLTHLDKLKSKRLGYRFEAFVAYWLQISPNFELLAHNIQIIENKVTLGEVDFIVKNQHSHKIIHLEVAVKFYLGTAPFDNAFRWFGTNTHDQLGKKQQHLLQNQTQLSLKYPQHLNHKIDQRHCLLKGRLFYPYGTQTSPSTATGNHLRGFWIKQSDVSKEASLKNKLLFRLEKNEWLSTLQHLDLQTKEAVKSVYDKDRAQCYIMVEKDKESSSLKENERIFILPDYFKFPDF